ncbi:MAG: galactokinase [Anaerolineae bacterium]|nr:galactokinase [Anaerolineae bacterium]
MRSALGSALQGLYGDEMGILAAQERRYTRAIRAFGERYGRGEVLIFRAPGRINLIGEHTDYNHGYVMPMALDKDLLLLIRPRPDAQVHMANTEAAFPESAFEIAEQIPLQQIGHWANYAQGPAQLLAQEYGPGLRGFDALVEGAPPHGIPRGAGLSSSSALTVASALALVEINGIALQGAELADACGRAEWYVGTRGGIMDQFISILAQRDHALFLDCRPAPDGSGYRYAQVPMPPGYAVLVVDSQVRHRNTGPQFNRRVAEGRIGVRLLQRRLPPSEFPRITHLRDVQHVPWEKLEPLLPESIDGGALRQLGIDPDRILDQGVSPETDTFLVRRRCRHVHSENQRVLRSQEALLAGDMATFVHLLHQAHASARDDYEISTPEIEVLVALAESVSEQVGARLTGAGWGGCVIVVTPWDQLDAVRNIFVSGYRAETGLETQLFVCRSAPGAGRVLNITV